MKKNDKKIMNGKPNGFPLAPRRTTPPSVIILKDENYLKDENGNKIITNKKK